MLHYVGDTRMFFKVSCDKVDITVEVEWGSGKGVQCTGGSSHTDVTYHHNGNKYH